MWLLYSSWNVKLTAEKEAYTTKSVQITNYIKAKSTLRYIYMIQMCVYNSILAGRLGYCWLAALGDCWLAPGKAAGWPLGWLAGPWEGWVAPGKAATAGCARRLVPGVCWFAEFADFCWFAGRALLWVTTRISLGTDWIRFAATVNLAQCKIERVLLERF